LSVAKGCCPGEDVRSPSGVLSAFFGNDHAPAACVLGLIDAALGRKDEALREGRAQLSFSR
jgi:hypothetical protein